MTCTQGRLCSEKIKNHLINEEQKRQIDIHKWLTSEKCGFDRGNEAIREWVHRYSQLFREWAESIPYECIECLCCKEPQKGSMCKQPFSKGRVEVLEKFSKKELPK